MFKARNKNDTDQIVLVHRLISASVAMHGSRGEGARGCGPLLENHKKNWFLVSMGPDPLKITKLPSQLAFNVGPTSVCQRNTI